MPDPDECRRFLAPGPCHAGQVITLRPDQSRHMVTVLRIAAGRHVRVFTGQGEEFIALVEQASPEGARVRIIEPCRPAQIPGARLTVAFAPPPGQRTDFLIEKATELGANALQPLLCERLQGFQAAGAASRTARWRRKAEEAAKQCQRTAVPEVLAPAPFEDFVRRTSDELRLIGSPGDAPTLWRALSEMCISGPPRSVAMAVGPAGGFARHELDVAAEAAFVPVSLGPHILRVETAAICLLTGVVLYLEGLREHSGEAARNSSRGR
jgi:16S rRNA (uracil1498-N3)-methyltransferase